MQNEIVDAMAATGVARGHTDQFESFVDLANEVAESCNLFLVSHPRSPRGVTSMAPRTNVPIGPHSELGRTAFRCAAIGFYCELPAKAGGETILVDTSLETECGQLLSDALPSEITFTGSVHSLAVPDGARLSGGIDTRFGRLEECDLINDEWVMRQTILTNVNSVFAPGVTSASTSLLGPYTRESAVVNSAQLPESTYLETARTLNEHQVEVSLGAGDWVFVDNCRVLHARAGYAGDRRIHSILISEFQSAMG